MTEQSTNPSIRITKATGKWVVYVTGAIFAETTKALRVEEEGKTPVVYVPRADVAMAFFDASGKVDHDPGKGDATFYSLDTRSTVLKDIAWSYEAPVDAVADLAGYMAFDDERINVEQQ